MRSQKKKSGYSRRSRKADDILEKTRAGTGGVRVDIKTGQRRLGHPQTPER